MNPESIQCRLATIDLDLQRASDCLNYWNYRCSSLGLGMNQAFLIEGRPVDKRKCCISEELFTAHIEDLESWEGHKIGFTRGIKSPALGIEEIVVWLSYWKCEAWCLGRGPEYYASVLVDGEPNTFNLFLDGRLAKDHIFYAKNHWRKEDIPLALIVKLEAKL